jgi:cobalt-zinc-cadmium efflux system outer membrane protein
LRAAAHGFVADSERRNSDMKISMRLLAGALLLLGGCAGIPEDRGFGQVQAQLRQRGYEGLLRPDDERAQALADQLLAAGPLQADDAVRVALLRNPRLREVYAQLGFSAAEVYDAGRPANPRLGGSVLFTGAAGAQDRYDYGLSQDFLGVLLLPARSRLAAADFERAQQQAGAAVLEVAAETRAAWYRLAAAAQAQALRETVADAADVSAELAQRYYAAGNLAALDLELQQAEAAQARAEALRARDAALAARGALAQAMGLPAQRQDWSAAARLPAPLARDEALPELLELAQRSRLDLAAQRSEVSQQEQALGLSRSTRLLGTVDAGVQGERDVDGTHLLGPAVSLELPLFNPGDGKVLRAQARLERSRAELERLENQAGRDIALAQARVAASHALALRYMQETIPLRERIVRHSLERANSALAGPFELIRARREQYEADQQYLETLRDYWLARNELERQVGARLPGEAPAAAGGQP